VVEAVLVILFLAGLWFGRKSRFLWLSFAGFVFDMVIHLGLGFGLNEVYIMASHWAFVMPICIAYSVLAASRYNVITLCRYNVVRILLILITLFLWLYNGSLLVSYLLGGAS
jgi:hypothetical protein